MVYGVCRRLLPESDAEDAFQATFLVLAEKARTVAPREAVGNWLYGVARRAALLARRSIARRRERMTELTDLPARAPDPMEGLRAVLDEEVSRLADAHRTVIVLCDLEGRTRKEAAAILGWPEGTVAGRLAQARRLLAKRLARHAPAVSVAAVLAGTSKAPAVVLALTHPAVVPASVAALTRTVLANMAGGKLMKTLITVLVLACAGVGLAFGVGQDKGTSPTPNPLVSTAAAAEEPVKADPIFWGEEVDGLKAGLSLAETPRIEKTGGSARLEVKFKLHIRNVGNAPVTINYGAPREDKPTIIDAAGDAVQVAMPPVHFGSRPNYSRVIKPVETFTLFDHELIVEVDAKQLSQTDVKVPTVRVPRGKYTVSYSGMVSSQKRLATGVVPFKVMDPERVTKAGREDEKVAWGKEVSGLQAGLVLKDARPYRQGETVTVVVRVRNIGKEEVKFRYCRETYFEEPPTVTDGKGKRIPLERLHATGFAALVPVNLVPGKEIEVGERQIELKATLFGPGKFGVQYEQLETPENDKTLSKLATGKLELEVKEAKDAQRPDDGPGATAERYLAAALAGRVDEAIGLALKGTSPRAPSDRTQVSEFRKRVVASEIRLWKVLAAWDAGEAVAVTEEFQRLEFQPAEKENPNVAAPPRVEGQPEGTRAAYVSAFLVFKVVKSGDRWLVKDADVTTEKDALDRVEAFKAKHPAATPVPARAADPKAGPENKLIGTWKLVSAKYDGEAVTFPEGVTTVKHVTPTQFMWAGYGKDGKVIRAAGGSYSLKGDAYEETPEYGVGKDFDGIKGKAQTFKWKVEGDRWHHTGKLDNGPTIDEVWERVEKR
jgi:RNA polymerase sigma factor (sigma-70 family)